MASGDVLADRYELQDLVTEQLGSVTWRANDASSTATSASRCCRAPIREPTTSSRPPACPPPSPIRGSCGCSTSSRTSSHHLVVREWARAFPLDQLLAQSPLPNRARPAS